MAPVADELVTKAAAGSEEALSELLTRYGPTVRERLHIDPIWRSTVDAADIMQVTYLEAFLDRDQLKARTIQAFVSWLTRIAQNNLRDCLRELERQKRLDPRLQVVPGPPSDSSTFSVPVSTTQTPSRAAAQREFDQALQSALTQLPSMYAEVIRRHDLAGVAMPDVAAALGRSTGAAYLMRLRALGRLRNLLGAETKFFSDGV